MHYDVSFSLFVSLTLGSRDQLRDSESVTQQEAGTDCTLHFHTALKREESPPALRVASVYHSVTACLCCVCNAARRKE